MVEAGPHEIPDDDYTLLLANEVAAIFRVDPKTVSRWAAAGRFPPTPDGLDSVVRTLGNRYRFRASTIRRLRDNPAVLHDEPQPNTPVSEPGTENTHP